MALKLRKLSEITPASPTSQDDQIVGVIGGTTDALYKISDVRGLPPVSADPRFFAPLGELQLYVDVAGSDSNPGTQAQPFLTLNHALTVANKFDYELAFEPAIFMGAGTFIVPAGASGESSINLPALHNMQALDSGLIQGVAAGTTIIETTGFPFGAFQAGSSKTSNWRIGQLSIDTPFVTLLSVGGQIEAFDVEFRDTSNSGIMEIARAENAAEIFLQGNIVISATTFAYLFHLFFNARGFCSSPTTITLPVACTVTQSFISVFQDSSCWFQPASITNAGGVTGNNLTAIVGSSVFTANGLVSDIPGTGPTLTHVDTTSSIVKNLAGTLTANFAGGPGSLFATQFSGTPVSTDISSGCWTVVKDTSGGGVYVLYNDAGTIKKVALV